MQSFSPVLLLAQVDGNAPTAIPPKVAAMLEAMRANTPVLPWWFFVGNFLLGVLAIWASSKLFAGKKGTIGRALLLVLGWIGMGIVLTLILGLGLVVMVMKANAAGGEVSGTGLAVFGVFFLLLFLVGTVTVPSVVYEINALKSIGFVVVYVVLGASLQTAFEFVVFGSTLNARWEGIRAGIAMARRSPAEVEKLRGQLRQRKSELERRYQQLEIHRVHLPPGDARERASYEREKADYEADLERLRAEAALLPPAP